jgi:hypothetical protein
MHNKRIKEAETLLKTLSQFLFLCISAYSTAVGFLQIDGVDVKKNQRKKGFLSSEKVKKILDIIDHLLLNQPKKLSNNFSVTVL